MAAKLCFTPVTIKPPAGGVPMYTIMTVTTVPADSVALLYRAGQTYVQYDPAPGAATPIKFFKFTVGNTAPKYIEKHDDDYAVAIGDVVIDAANPKTYLVMRETDDFAGGSKSSRKGRKSARKGRKSARKSRRDRGSRSKK